jgi:hypothetical protein
LSNALGGSSAAELLILFRPSATSSASSASAASTSPAQSASTAVSAAAANDPINTIKHILAGAQMEQRLPTPSGGQSATTAMIEAAYAEQTGSRYALSFAGANEAAVWGGGEQSFAAETRAHTPAGESTVAIAGVAFGASILRNNDGYSSDNVSSHLGVIAASLTTVSTSKGANGATTNLVAAQTDAFYLSNSVGSQSAAIGFEIGGLGKPVAVPSLDWTSGNAVVSVGTGDVRESFSIFIQNGNTAATTSLTVVGLNMAQAQQLEASFANAAPTYAGHDALTETRDGGDAHSAFFGTSTDYFSGPMVAYTTQISDGSAPKGQ